MEIEWKNGDRCVYKNSGAVVIGWHPSYPILIIDSDEFGLESCSACELSEPEAPEQKNEREMVELARDFYELTVSVGDACGLPSSLKAWDRVSIKHRNFLTELAIALNYRGKQ